MPIKNMPHAAMVFAAGLGTRMRPITDKTPKPLVEVGGKALMDHMLDRFAEAGVERAVVNVHYLADQIEAHLAPRKTPQIIISDERDKLLDQGGGIVKALPLLGKDPFFVCNTDSFWIEGAKSNLEKLAELWNPDEMDVLLLVAPTSNSIGVDWPGDFHMDPTGRLIRRDERDVSAFVYAGVGIVKPELFAHETRDVFRLAPIFFAAAEAGRLFGARLEGIWLHVGTPEMIAEAEKTIARSVL
ncbi:nucleotidyltransferase family protein [Roseiarcaceae bacterium H3SJ34-1]|uniref:nucleotidyltransferase family protein n=1 Tax=Terripilifer ovatus TaxID=3032367 RepID=UPI003AB9714E|nr:nucleotidyltransferase family protein [Roseiarcaceae bacterium H3SJ34-1]